MEISIVRRRARASPHDDMACSNHKKMLERLFGTFLGAEKRFNSCKKLLQKVESHGSTLYVEYQMKHLSNFKCIGYENCVVFIRCWFYSGYHDGL